MTCAISAVSSFPNLFASGDRTIGQIDSKPHKALADRRPVASYRGG